MKLMNINRIATIRNRAEIALPLYSLVGGNDQYAVTLKSDPARSYSVDLAARSCNCDAFKKEKYCKHAAMVQMEEECRNLEAREAAFHELETGREELEAARIERCYASVAGAAARISFPIETFAQYEAAANLPNLTAAEREELTYDFDRLYKRAI